ncbi:AraC-like DNA-binding protein [Saccharothrix coeruleofusca]|uniref:AraC family transcriptional regulator n=1 Tax=Saccharothrix coeruleofusca TaxID=33919 RepID=UPI001AE384E5|nr:AraC family transcriptional regulator [Saccharothrix coeruleofusca]MBP2335617.1 AraC-like DNA-binding protein [Saccharothrix coeruleofusca]
MTAVDEVLSWKSMTAERQAAPVGRKNLLYRVSDEWLAIITPLSGACQVECWDGSCWQHSTVMQGEVCRIAPGSLVRVRRVPPRNLPFELGYVRLPTGIFERFARTGCADAVQEILALNALRSLDTHLASVLSALVRAKENGAGDYYAYSASLYLVTCLISPHTAEPQSAGGLSPAQLLTVVDYMKDNLQENITLDQLAGSAGVSRYHFLRQFSESTGETPLQYLTRMRVSTARHLLAVDAEPISQVGRRCGFQTPENFARVFRKWVGCSPSQYRKRAQENAGD